jgi:IS5 family transposase
VCEAQNYGYKNHININRVSKLITASVGTDASVHDSQVLNAVLREAQVGDKEVWADSAYRSDAQERRLAGRAHDSQIQIA